jgi:hypothetical protein
LFPARDSLAAGLTCQAALVALVLATAALGGARPAAPTWLSPFYGVALAALFVRVLGPWLMRLPARLGLAGFERGLASTAPLPTAYLVLAVLVGGCAEEWLYRAYGFERASALFGSEWLGGAFVVTAFGVAHLPMWGLGPSLTTLISGALFTAFYAWRRDLCALVIAHVATDFVGLVVATRFSASPRAQP